jgi:hypothetical protein
MIMPHSCYAIEASGGAAAQRTRSDRRRRIYADRMSMPETCHCCQALAPAWSSPDYAEWHVAIAADGTFLGVVCVGCLGDDELILIELESFAQAA